MFEEYQSVVLAGPAPAPSMRVPILCDPVFTETWITRIHAQELPDVHAIRTYVFENIVVSGRGHLFIKDKLVTEPDFIPEYWRNILASDPSIIESERKLPVRVVEEPCVVFMGHDQQVYGHFLVEMLPRLEIARLCLDRLGVSNVRYLINDSASQWLRHMILDLGIKETEIVGYSPWKERVLLRFGIVPVFPSRDGIFHPFSNELFQGVLDRMTPSIDPLVAQQRKVYLTRRGFQNQSSEKRIFTNELEACELAEVEFGFETISPETLSWVEQMSLFRSASLIVGEAGSALHNSLFSSNGAQVGSIGFRNMMQSSIGALRGQRNSYLKTREELGENNKYKMFSIDRDLYRRWLEGLCYYHEKHSSIELSEHLANSSNSVKENQMADQYRTSASSGKPAAPDGADELRDAAMAAITRGEWLQALENLLEAHRRRPDGPFIRLLLAQTLLELGRTEEARPHLDAIPDISELEPLLSELRARAKDELLVNSAASTKTQGGLISRLKKLFAKLRDSRKN